MIPASEIATKLFNALACPLCRGGIAPDGRDFACTACGCVFPQNDLRVLDLLPPDQWQVSGWVERQADMTRQYKELAADPEHTRVAYVTDFGPFRPLLANVRGSVLDIGGGHGLIRDFLPTDIDYVSLDPSIDWFDETWQASAGTFPSLANPPFFVRGIGERIPFRDETFSAVFSIWSLNHTVDPRRVIREARRVLNAHGRFFLCLDDIPPRWGDIISGQYRDLRFATRHALVRAKMKGALAGWPLQPDHLRISEQQIRSWTAGLFQLDLRKWIGAYLVLDFRAV
jgi:SAM-dependent methyltransferase